MKEKLEFLTIMQSEDKISKLDPWTINVSSELTEILKILEEKINLFICGTAAENSASIHWKKVKKIMELQEKPIKEKKIKTDINQEYDFSSKNLPSIQLLTKGGAPVIDISEILDSLMEFLEENENKSSERLTPLQPLPNIQEDFIKRMKQISLDILAILEKLFEIVGKEISFKVLIKSLGGVKPVEVFITLLFLYMDGLLDLDQIELEDGEFDIKITSFSNE